MISEILPFLCFLFSTGSIITSIYLIVKRNGDSKTSQQIVKKLCEEAKVSKEKEIEKTDSRILVNNSVNAAEHGSRKDELKSKLNSRIDEITEAFLRG